jgi:hypothetical protein
MPPVDLSVVPAKNSVYIGIRAAETIAIKWMRSDDGLRSEPQAAGPLIEIEKTLRCIDPQATLCGSPRNDW